MNTFLLTDEEIGWSFLYKDAQFFPRQITHLPLRKIRYFLISSVEILSKDTVSAEFRASRPKL